MRRILSVVGLAASLAAIAPLAFPQVNPPAFIGCSSESSVGTTDYNLAGTDLTTRAQAPEVWAIESPSNFKEVPKTRFTVFSDDLLTVHRTFEASFPEPGFGIAEIPEGHPNAGRFYILSPEIQDGGYLNPGIGIMDDQGNLIPGGEFLPIIDPSTGSPPGFSISEGRELIFQDLDAHPTSPEIAIQGYDYNSYEHYIAFIGLPEGDPPQYRLIRGPFKVEGLASDFGGGICYNSDSTVLVLSRFWTAFECYMALEYDVRDGKYTGKSVVLPRSEFFKDERLLALGIDTGTMRGSAALFLYDAVTDAICAFPPDTLDAPGPIRWPDAVTYGLTAPAINCQVLPDGRAKLTWTNPPEYSYDHIEVLENGTLIDTIPGDTVEFTTRIPPWGKYVFCLKTVKGGAESPMAFCCEGQSDPPRPGKPPGTRINAGSGRYLWDLACPRVVAKKEDFRCYIILDGKVMIVDFNFANKGEIPIQLAGGPASGIAIIDVTVEGIKVPMFILLDYDGPAGDLIPSATIHYLKETLLPITQTLVPAGTQYKDTIQPIDFIATPPEGIFITSWDTDENGDLITMENQNRRIIKIRYDEVNHTLTAIEQAFIPLDQLSAYKDLGFPYPLGQVSVLPNGNYLLMGGSPLDFTVSRAYLLSPLNVDPNLSLKVLGPVEGIYSFAQPGGLSFLGWDNGNGENYGFETVAFEDDGTGALFYTLGYALLMPTFITPGIILIYPGNYLLGMMSEVSRQGLLPELLLDDAPGVVPGGVLDTNPLSPSFAGDATKIDYHWQIINSSQELDLEAEVVVLLDGLSVPELSETVTIPPGRDFYRAARERDEKTIQLRITNRSGDQNIRVIHTIVGATTIRSATGFLRGDGNGDGDVNISDAINILLALFAAGETPCPDAIDVDDSGVVDLTDVVVLLNWLYLGGTRPSTPGPFLCGPDPTEDQLDPCTYTCR